MAQHRASCLVAICVLRGVSSPPVRRRKEQKVLDVLELGHIMARQLVQLAGPFMQLRAFQRRHAVVQRQESIRPKAGSCFCHLLAMDLRRSQLASLSLHLLAYKIGTLIDICIVLCGVSEIKYMFNLNYLADIFLSKRSRGECLFSHSSFRILTFWEC